MFGTDIMIKLRMFGFTNIPELVSPPPPSILKTPEGCKEESCVFVFLYFYSPPLCVQFNIFDSILIFVPNIWGSYQVLLLSLGPVSGGPWGREGTISKMCLQLNILDSILTVGLQHLSGAQLSGAPGPTFWGPAVRGPIIRGPICLEHTEMFCPNIRIDWKMFSHIP